MSSNDGKEIEMTEFPSKKRARTVAKDIRHGTNVLSRGAIVALQKEAAGNISIDLAKDQNELVDRNALRRDLIKTRNCRSCKNCRSTTDGSNCVILKYNNRVDEAVDLLVKTRRDVSNKTRDEKDIYMYARFRETLETNNDNNNSDTLTHTFTIGGIKMCRILWCFYYDISKEYLENCSMVSYFLYLSLSLSHAHARIPNNSLIHFSISSSSSSSSSFSLNIY